MPANDKNDTRCAHTAPLRQPPEWGVKRVWFEREEYARETGFLACVSPGAYFGFMFSGEKLNDREKPGF